jgi:hypothetical protein
MPSYPRLTWRTKAAGAAVCAAAGLVALAGTASATAAPATTRLPKPGTNLIHNGNFASPGPATHEGATPTDWSKIDLGAEMKPFSASINAWNAKGEFPPPKGNPDKSDIAAEIFYEAGTSVGVEGFGGQQTRAQFGRITQANNPMVSFSDVAHKAPGMLLSDWAGSGVEVVIGAGKHTDTLIYFNPWMSTTGPYSSKPANSPTVKYIMGPTLSVGEWTTWKPRSLNADIKKEFGIKFYPVLDVRIIVLEDTVNSGGSKGPFPNMDAYVSDLAITEGK